MPLQVAEVMVAVAVAPVGAGDLLFPPSSPSSSSSSSSSSTTSPFVSFWWVCLNAYSSSWFLFNKITDATKYILYSKQRKIRRKGKINKK